MRAGWAETSSQLGGSRGSRTWVNSCPTSIQEAVEHGVNPDEDVGIDKVVTPKGCLQFGVFPNPLLHGG